MAFPSTYGWSPLLSTLGDLPSLPEGSGAPASLPQHIHPHYPCPLFLQGIQHSRFHCLAYAGHPKPSLMKAYSTTHPGSTMVNRGHSRPSVSSTSWWHYLPLKTCSCIHYLLGWSSGQTLCNHSSFPGSYLHSAYSLGSSQPPGELTPSTTVALGNLSLPSPALAGLRLTGHQHSVPSIGQASTLAPQRQEQCAMGSPHHWQLWSLLQQQTCSTQASRSQSSPVHKGAGHLPSFHAGSLAICVHSSVRQQNWPLPAGLPSHHRLYKDSVWSLQGLVHCPVA